MGSSLDATVLRQSRYRERLFARPGVDGLQLDLGSPDAVSGAVPSLQQRLAAGMKIIDWRDSQGSLFAAVRMEKIMVGVLLLAVIAVAAFNIVSTLTMSVTEKSRDITVLRVMGVTAGGSCCCSWGTDTAGRRGHFRRRGTGCAVIPGHRRPCGLDRAGDGSQLFDPAVYYIGRLPSDLFWTDVLATTLLALLLSTLATLYPAWRASRIAPAEVLDNG